VLLRAASASINALELGGRIMSKGTVNCSHCNALYQVIRAEAGPETTERDVACRVCDGPLAAREGQFVLKYFLLRKAIGSPKWQRQSIPNKT
jgi:hypothetical protein